MDKYLNEEVSGWSEADKANFSRNDTLINLENIPAELKAEIINNYNDVKVGSKQRLLNYFIEHKLKNLIDVIEEF